MSPDRIAELQAATGPNWDLSRLVDLCRELNIAWANGMANSVSSLTRAIMDHVPPIFGCATFSELANNYAGTRSFRETMQFLDKAARKIADANLHTQVRNREVLPTTTQVNFSAALDLLLSEVVRVSKAATETNEQLRGLVSRAQELIGDFLCPQCRSPIRELGGGSDVISSEYGEYDISWEEVIYECGRRTVDDEEVEPCPHRGPVRAV